MKKFKTKTALIMLSGGLDSSFLLYYLLNNTDLNIFTHHISHRYDQEPRWKPEDKATKDVVAFCKSNYRKFEHSESRFDFLGFPMHVGWDSDLQLLVASKVAPNLLSENVSVVIGWTMDDLERDIVQQRMKRNATNNMWKACRDSIDTEAFKNNLNSEIWMPLIDMKYYKKDILKKCPKELINLTWSCRTPKDNKPCGECLPCQQFKNLRRFEKK